MAILIDNNAKVIPCGNGGTTPRMPPSVTTVAKAAMAAFVMAAPALAQQAGSNVVLSDNNGRAMVVGVPADATGALAPATMTGRQIAAEFARLCLDEPASAAGRVAGSAWQLVPDDAIFPATGKAPAAHIAQWRGPSARVSVSNGDPAALAALKGQPVSIRDRGIVITGGYGSFKAAGVQCNADLSLAGFADAQGLADALAAAVGQPPSKLVVKTGYADGYWETPAAGGTRRVAFSIVDLKKPAQPLHLTVQILPPKGQK